MLTFPQRDSPGRNIRDGETHVNCLHPVSYESEMDLCDCRPDAKVNALEDAWPKQRKPKWSEPKHI